MDTVTDTKSSRHTEIKETDSIVVRFSGDSGDGMQLTGMQFTDTTALLGKDISTFPELAPWKIEMCFAVIGLLSYGNLRGVEEAGKAFALPTYLFVFSMFTVFGIGIYRELTTGLPRLNPDVPGAIEIGKPVVNSR